MNQRCRTSVGFVLFVTGGFARLAAAAPSVFLPAGADALRVEPADGRVQEISFGNIAGSGQSTVVEIVESKDGKEVRRETTLGSDGKRMGAHE